MINRDTSNSSSSSSSFAPCLFSFDIILYDFLSVVCVCVRLWESVDTDKYKTPKEKERKKEKKNISFIIPEKREIRFHCTWNPSFFLVSVCDFFFSCFPSCTPNCCVPITQDSWRVKRPTTDQSDREENLLENFLCFSFLLLLEKRKKKTPQKHKNK